MKRSSTDLTAGLPAPKQTTSTDVRRAIEQSGRDPFFVVLDDDPTGTQSVGDLPVLTAWEVSDFDWALSTGADACYVMTNSRSLDEATARTVCSDVVRAARAAGETAGRELAFVSRSDSTLRGHYPAETGAIADELAAGGLSVDGIVVVPAFPDAGRITIASIHYAGSETAGFEPVSETEFARDNTFAFSSSHLPTWIAEKSRQQTAAAQVIVIDLELLRTDREAVVAQLRSAVDRQPIVCDITCEEDLRELSIALIEAESVGSRFVYRVGPPFMRARLGQDVRQPLTPQQVAACREGAEPAKGGLVVVGSHVALTTSQLARLVDEQNPTRLEISVTEVVSGRREEHLRDIVADAVTAMTTGNVVIATSREVIKGADGDSSLDIARQVSAAVVTVVQQILARIRPRFVIAKGGITSSDVAAKGLAMRHAWVVGPTLPGIASLLTAQDGPAKGIPYVIFAGNVGDESSLAAVTKKLSN